MLKKIKTIIWVVIISIVLTFLYRSLFRNILEFESVHMSSGQVYEEFDMNIQQKKDISEHPENYIRINYDITLKNKSDKLFIIGLSIKPIFFGNLKKIVFWTDPSFPMAEDDPYNVIEPQTDSYYKASAIIKCNDLSDKAVLEEAKKVRLRAEYITADAFPTTNHNWWKNTLLGLLTFTFNSKEFNYK
jgi:hypothetical protein